MELVLRHLGFLNLMNTRKLNSSRELGSAVVSFHQFAGRTPLLFLSASLLVRLVAYGHDHVRTETLRENDAHSSTVHIPLRKTYWVDAYTGTSAK